MSALGYYIEDKWVGQALPIQGPVQNTHRKWCACAQCRYKRIAMASAEDLFCGGHDISSAEATSSFAILLTVVQNLDRTVYDLIPYEMTFDHF